ncbi:MAG: TraA family conjugative transfer protein [Pseudomonadota bacterium]
MVMKQKTLAYIAIAATLTFLATTATAGVSGAEFLPIFTLLSDWIGGYLGRTIAFTGMILGVGAAALSQRPVLGLVGLFFGVVVLVMPTVLNAMLTAVI